MASDEGSAAAELIILTPLLIIIMVAVAFLTQLVIDRQQVDDLARTAAEAAASADSAGGASYAATVTAAANEIGDNLRCAHLSVETDTSAFVAGGRAVVTVRCVAEFGGVLGSVFPGQIDLVGTGAAVIEPYRMIGSGG